MGRDEVELEAELVAPVELDELVELGWVVEVTDCELEWEIGCREVEVVPPLGWVTEVDEERRRVVVEDGEAELERPVPEP